MLLGHQNGRKILKGYHGYMANGSWSPGIVAPSIFCVTAAVMLFIWLLVLSEVL
jgi:hypothetical protein